MSEMSADIPIFFKPGQPMLLVDERDRQYLINLPGPEDLPVHIRGEALRYDVLVEVPVGGVLITAQRHRYLVVSPTLEQVVMNMPRQAQVIYPKDLGLMLMWGDVAPGQQIIEVGCGHGAMTMTLLRAVGPQGHLTTYDIRRDHLNRTRKNIALYLGAEYLDRWTPVVADPSCDGFAPELSDRLFTDVPEPWTMLDVAARAIKPGGTWMAYVPTVPQLTEIMHGLNYHPAWSLAESFEALQRWWHVRPPSVRPRHGMKSHTGFMIVSRRRHIKAPRLMAPASSVDSVESQNYDI